LKYNMFPIPRRFVRTSTLAAALLVATSEPCLAGGPGGNYGGGGAYGGGNGGGIYSGGGSGRGFYGAYSGYGGLYGGGSTPYWAVGPTNYSSANFGYQAGAYYYQPGYSAPFVTNPSLQQNYTMGWDPFAAVQSNLPARILPARIRVEVPDPTATVTFDGAKTTSMGTVREFQTAPLEAGQYTYVIQASWMQDGHMKTQTQKVHVAPGARSIVTFVPG
jgi:uncharacterized protein (TIGR03000 family)